VASQSFDHLSGLTPQQRAEVDERIEAFERAWEGESRPQIADYLSTDDAVRRALLIELVQIDAERRVKRGEPVQIDSYRQEFPELASRLEGGKGWEGLKRLLSTPIPAAIPEQPGGTVGNYKLLEQIGEGGFGLVFVAEQERPVRRKVALKVIKPGMDTREVVARFEAERQALALMDHPNIARVIDGGTTESGRPYFVMELVRGIPITDYCDRHHLGPRERLELFVSVCQAVQHAHQKGIIHRDIKPSNVLVTQQEGKPLVKVIDFGVAKALYQPLTEKTIHTQFAQVLGTPLYMSPEQAEVGGLDIDTRSDIYSLGVLLYELLTGTTPIDRKRFLRAAFDEVLRIIRKEEFPRPSTRLSALGDTASTVAVNRGLDVKRLSQVLAGDLDWVVMKALEKDRGRRYDSASAFAEDVERYLHDQAIVARPPSKAYQFKKFVRRNRGPVLTSAIVAAALVTGIALATWQALRATRAANSERLAKNEAVARGQETEAVLKFVEDRVFAAARPEGQQGGLGRDVTLRNALEYALPYVDQSFPGQPLIEARLRHTLGDSFRLLGDLRTAAAQEEAARNLYVQYRGPDHPDTLRATFSLAATYNDSGRLQDAHELHEKVLAINEQLLAVQKTTLGRDDPETLKTMKNLANSYAALGRADEALTLRQQTLALEEARVGKDDLETLHSLYNLGLSYFSMGRYGDARNAWQEMIARTKAKFGADHPDVIFPIQGVLACDTALGRPADAVKLCEQALGIAKSKLGADHVQTLALMLGLAACYDAAGRHAEARKLKEETLAIEKVKLGIDHPNTLRSMNDLAESYRIFGNPADALKLRQQALDLAKAKLGADHQDTLFIMDGVAGDLAAVGRDAEALQLIDECLQRTSGKVVDPRLRPALLDQRLRHFQKAKDGAGCRQCAEIWEKQPCANADCLYNAACFRAVAAATFRANGKSATAAREADAEADRAMACLKQAVAAGYKDGAAMQKDDDLAALRSREDFKKLVTDLDAKKPKTP
jgi:eukaryotic-like serine/threonine-protein kinase